MKMNKAQPTLSLSLSLSTESQFADNRGLPTTANGVAPTITAVYDALGVSNMISVAHYPKMGVGVVYETP
jgi:hypothetical protein